jgi:fumarate reductase flavoprotein subunit
MEKRSKASKSISAIPEKASFEIPPPPIPAKDINKIINTEVVVVGAGVSGLTAAVSAAEAGAKVILIEKGDTFHYRGLHNAAFNSRLQREVGVKVSKEEVIQTIMEWGQYRADQRIVKLWADNCDQVMDWLLDLADEANVKVVLDLTTKPWFFRNYPLIHVFMPDRQLTLVTMLQNKAKSLGVEFYFEHPAVRLLREGKGRNFMYRRLW